MLAFGLGVVFFRNPVTNAMSLVICFVFLSAIFVMLDAFFIGIIQILVYAGAVMVLFLFIIMLLNIRAERSRRLNFTAIGGGSLVIAAFLGALTKVLSSSAVFQMTKPPLENPGFSDVQALGLKLFSVYNLPFQVIGVLLLVATIGAVVISKRELK